MTRGRGLALALAGSGLIGLNGLAYCHARALTRFADGGVRTPPPEALGRGVKLGLFFTGARIPKPANRWTPADVGLAFERHSLSTPDGVRLEAWYVPHRAGRGLVLLFHGYADAKAALLPEAKALYDLGYASFLVDFRGSGDSSGQVTSLGYHEAVDVAAALDYSRRLPASRRVLLGASMGAAAVLRAVARNEARADALILESPFDRLLTAVEHRCAAVGVPAFPLAPLLVFWGGVQQGFGGFGHDPVKYASRVDRPTLLLHGEADRRVTTAEVRAIFERLLGPKDLVLFPGASHGSLQKADPVRWKAAVARFLE